MEIKKRKILFILTNLNIKMPENCLNLSDQLFTPSSSSQVPHAVSPVGVPLPPQAVPPSVPSPHHLWPLGPGPQTRLPLHPLRPEEVAPCPHPSPGLPEGSPEAPSDPHPALPGHIQGPAEETPAGWSVCGHPPYTSCCAKYCRKSGRK